MSPGRPPGLATEATQELASCAGLISSTRHLRQVVLRLSPELISVFHTLFVDAILSCSFSLLLSLFNFPLLTLCALTPNISFFFSQDKLLPSNQNIQK